MHYKTEEVIFKAPLLIPFWQSDLIPNPARSEFLVKIVPPPQLRITFSKSNKKIITQKCKFKFIINFL